MNSTKAWLKRPRSVRTLVKASMIIVAMTFVVSLGILARYPVAAEANSLAVFERPAHHTATTHTAAPANTSPQQSTTTCTPAATASLSAPAISSDQPGLHQNITANNTYTVYGNSINDIANQMNRCTPSGSGSDRYAASTDYALTWSFSYQSNDSGLCIITGASVGLTLTQTYPSWQPGTSSNPALTSAWKTFIANLSTHENGHSQLDQAAAATLLKDLQNFPATDCGSIETRANAQANAELATLDQANDAYDATTNHGVTQGAVLR